MVFRSQAYRAKGQPAHTLQTAAMSTDASQGIQRCEHDVSIGAVLGETLLLAHGLHVFDGNHVKYVEKHVVKI